MTWMFYTHNCPVVVAELLFNETTLERTYDPEGCMWVAGDKIMANPGGDQIWYSDDGGASWAQKANIPTYSTGYRAHKFAYLASADAWFLHLHYTGGTLNRDTRYWRSTNQGASWVQMDRIIRNGYERIDDYSTQALVIDSEGRMVGSGRGSDSNDHYAARWDTPATDITTDSWYRIGGAVNVDNLVETASYYNFLVLSGTARVIRALKKSMDGYINIVPTTAWPRFDERTCSIAVNDPSTWDSGATTWDSGATTWDQGEDFIAWKDTVYTTPGDVTEFYTVKPGSDTPISEISYDWGETMQWTKCQTDGTAVVILAKPVTPSKKLYAIRSEALSPLSFGAPVEIDLPYEPDHPVTQGQFYHKSGTTWIGYIISSNYTKIFQFEL